MTDSTGYAHPAVLANALAEQGAAYVRVANDTSLPERLTPLPDEEELVCELVRQHEPRLREALIPLFLRQPTLHRHVLGIVQDTDTESAQTLRHLYTAAVYLQHLWRGTLSIYLDDFDMLPDYYGVSVFNLPSPQHHYGEVGLRQLATHFREETGVDWLSIYEGAITRFLAQLSLAASQVSK